MKNFKLFLALTLCINLNSVHAEDEALEKVRIAHKVAQSFPRSFDLMISALKGIASYSQEEEDVKDCMMSTAILLEDSQNITTEADAQEFNTNFAEQMQKNIEVAERESEKFLSQKTELLSIIQIPQQIMKAYSQETKAMIGILAIRAMEADSSTEKEKIHSLISIIKAIETAKTENDAEEVGEKIMAFAKKVR
ncbi:MAG: hypothetical protein JO129_01100 [Candidatus Dependentiae bacterium]|nr:hypothetical protein [Candidatus Dependentiae bacterium]